MNGVLERLTGLRLESPLFLTLFVLLPLAFLARERRGRPSVRFAPAALIADGLPATWRVRLLFVPRLLTTLGLFLAIVALARPVERSRLPLEARGIDVLLALDVSSSMTELDLDPESTRFDVARAAAKSFIDARPDDRIGFLAFARYPDLRCPPTLDHDALKEIIDRTVLVRKDGPEDATGIGGAVAQASALLRASTARAKVVILLSDGDENVARPEAPEEIAPLHASQLAADLGIRVYAIAAGRGAPGPDGVFRPIDADPVQRLAARTGGRFYEVKDEAALADVYRRIDALEKVEFEEPRYETKERFAVLLLAALVAVALGTLLGRTTLEVLP